MPPVAFSPTVVALMHSPETIRLQQADLFSRPLDGLEEGTHYSIAQALPFLPAGPLRSAALRFANATDVSFSYKLAGANGGSPEFSFIQEPPAGIPYKNGTFLSTGGPGGDPVSSNSFEVNVGGITLIVGASTVLDEAGMPKPLIAPTLGGSFALADSASTFFFKTDPAAPLSTSLRTNLASMGVGTAVDVGWAYGLDAIGIPMGSSENTWGAAGGTLLTLAPAIESSLNPVYWPAFANAFRSSIGIGLGGAEGSSIFLAEGGIAGGAGVGGAAFQTLGVAGAVWMGGTLGGWITRHATAMDKANDPQGQLAALTYERYKEEACLGLGSTPLADIMAGLVSLNEIGDALFNITDPNEVQLSKGLKIAEEQIVSETKTWAGPTMDSVLVQALMANSNIKGHPEAKEGEISVDAMDFDGFKKTLKDFYRKNSDAIYAHDRVLQVLRQNGLVGDGDLGITRFIDNNGDITNEKGLKAYAAELMETHLKLRNEQLERMVKDCGLVVGQDGNFESKYGGAFTQEQLDFMKNTMPTLGGGIIRITNALATLKPEAISTN